MPVFKDEDPYVYAKLDENGRVECQLYFSDEAGPDSPMGKVFMHVCCLEVGDDGHFTNNETVAIESTFRLSTALDIAIEGYEMPAHDGAIDIKDRALFDSMRAELVEMIARIDALKFVALDDGD